MAKDDEPRELTFADLKKMKWVAVGALMCTVDKKPTQVDAGKPVPIDKMAEEQVLDLLKRELISLAPQGGLGKSLAGSLFADTRGTVVGSPPGVTDPQ